MNINSPSFSTIEHKDLGMTPYKVQLVQELKSVDHPMRFHFPEFFRLSSFWSWRVCKQAKLSHLGHRKLARMHWKPTRPKRHCLVWILVQMHNWAIFLRKWARRGRYSQWRSLSGYVERIFVHKNWRGEYWQHLVSTERRCVPHSRSYTRRCAPCS